jgi:excinuclease ABC subunit B
MRTAIEETDRRRAIQVAYNLERGLSPSPIDGNRVVSDLLMAQSKVPKGRRRRKSVDENQSPAELEKTMVGLEEEMLAAAEDLRFEYAAKLRDEIRDVKRQLDLALS